MNTKLYQNIINELSHSEISLGYEYIHLETTMSFASQLQEIYGGDMEIIVAAVLLHDLDHVNSNITKKSGVEEI